MTSPAKDNAPTRAYYFKLKIMTCKIQSDSSPASLCAIMKPIGEHLPLLGDAAEVDNGRCEPRENGHELRDESQIEVVARCPPITRIVLILQVEPWL